MTSHETRSTASARSGAAIATVPIVIASALTLGLTGQLPAAHAAPAPHPKKARQAPPAPTVKPAALHVQQLPAAPDSYTVVKGDSVSSVAERYGLSVPSVLALNGLSWSSLIHPGQVLRLTATPAAPPAPTAPAAPASGSASAGSASAAASYVVVRGDTVSAIAQQHEVNTAAVLAANGLASSSIIYPGQRLTIPAGAGAPATPAMTLASSVTPAAPAAPTTPASTTAWTVRHGDTLFAIAQRSGTTVQAIVAANGLGSRTIIVPGQVLRIPAAAAPSATVAPTAAAAVPAMTPAVAVTPATIPGLDAEQTATARTIVSVGRSLGVSDRGIIIALAAAAQESSLRNLTYGDRDSVGVYQQRPSQGWGTHDQLLDPAYSARLFFGGPTGPSAGRMPGLLDIRGWQTMSVAQAAQSVQRSAYPTAYAKWEAPATTWLAALS